jgi:hypothetical protein
VAPTWFDCGARMGKKADSPAPDDRLLGNENDAWLRTELPALPLGARLIALLAALAGVLGAATFSLLAARGIREMDVVVLIPAVCLTTYVVYTPACVFVVCLAAFFAKRVISCSPEGANWHLALLGWRLGPPRSASAPACVRLAARLDPFLNWSLMGPFRIRIDGEIPMHVGFFRRYAEASRLARRLGKVLRVEVFDETSAPHNGVSGNAAPFDRGSNASSATPASLTAGRGTHACGVAVLTCAEATAFRFSKWRALEPAAKWHCVFVVYWAMVVAALLVLYGTNCLIVPVVVLPVWMVLRHVATIVWAAGTDVLTVTPHDLRLTVSLIGFSLGQTVPRDEVQDIRVAGSLRPIFPPRFGRPYALRVVSDAVAFEFGTGLSEQDLRWVLMQIRADRGRETGQV